MSFGARFVCFSLRNKNSNESSRRLGAEQMEMPSHVQVVLEDLSAMAMGNGCHSGIYLYYIVLVPTKKP